jgi:hypothetical protein
MFLGFALILRGKSGQVEAEPPCWSPPDAPNTGPTPTPGIDLAQAGAARETLLRMCDDRTPRPPLPREAR